MSTEVRGIGMTSQRSRDRLSKTLSEMGIKSPRVLEVMRTIPRHLFVDEALASRAYENTALPIGFGQTISQPWIVARMTEILLDTGPVDKVLEIGTGCGYQSAVLAQFCRQIYSIERIEALAKKTRARLRKLKLHNVNLSYGDGWKGWPEIAPFDAILVAAAPAGIPEALLQQLNTGGRLIIPVGEKGHQDLRLITRRADGYEEQSLDAVSFVPMLEGMG